MSWKSEKDTEDKEITLSGGWIKTIDRVPDTDRIVQVIVESPITSFADPYGINTSPARAFDHSSYSPFTGWFNLSYFKVIAWSDIDFSAREFVKQVNK